MYFIMRGDDHKNPVCPRPRYMRLKTPGKDYNPKAIDVDLGA